MTIHIPYGVSNRAVPLNMDQKQVNVFTTMEPLLTDLPKADNLREMDKRYHKAPIDFSIQSNLQETDCLSAPDSGHQKNPDRHASVQNYFQITDT